MIHFMELDVPRGIANVVLDDGSRQHSAATPSVSMAMNLFKLFKVVGNLYCIRSAFHSRPKRGKTKKVRPFPTMGREIISGHSPEATTSYRPVTDWTLLKQKTRASL